MNREDIMRMAQKAGVRFYPSPWNEVELCSLDNLVRFHNLVASAEREACAPMVCEECAEAIRARGKS